MKKAKPEKFYNHDIWFAIDTESYKSLKRILKDGADPNCENGFGNSPLHVACFRESIESIKILLKHGAEINKEGMFRATPLHKLCSYARHITVDCVKILLDKGADCNIKDISGRIPLHYAVMWSNIGVVKLLVEAGSFLDTKDNMGLTPWDVALTELARRGGNITEMFTEVLGYIKTSTERYKNMKTIIPLLCMRTFIEDSVFYNDFLPMDVFKVIIGLVLKK